MSRNALKWLPAAVVPIVVVAAIIAVPLQADATVDLPDKTPEQVLLLVSDSTVSTFSGTVSQSTDLGLPDLNLASGMPSAGSSDVAAGASTAALTTGLELLSGSHEFRVYVGDQSKSRVQIKDHLAERDVIQNGSDLWFYDSSSNAATHMSVPAEFTATARARMADREAQLPTDLSTPAQLAERFLGGLDPTTTVAVGKDARVAGRDVYQLVLTPKSADTLVASVSIAVDAATGLPLQVTVLAQGQRAPALQVGFTAIDFAAPDAGLFDFVPPTTATVTEQSVPIGPDGVAADIPGDHGIAGEHGPVAGDVPVVTGAGWSSIVEVPAAAVPAELVDNPLLEQLTETVDGGRAVTTSLLTIFLADDGRIFAGAVPLAQLQAAMQ